MSFRVLFIRDVTLAYAAVLMGFLGGCDPSYHVVLYDERGTVLEGTAIGGGGPMAVAGSGIICSGNTVQTIATARMVASEGGWLVSCDDGRVIRGGWVQTETFGGAGSGADQFGNSFYAEFNVRSAALAPARARAAEAQEKALAAGQNPETSPQTTETEMSVGSGFIINSKGHLLTNQHVVDECTNVAVAIGRLKRTGTVVVEDPINDLAIVSVPVVGRTFATFRSGRWIRPGESVIAIGFPLRGLLAESPNVTTGAISALAGPGNDTRLIQITAPVQAGSSGGPLLDGSGNIVGIVVAKLDALRVAAATGDIPQNVNFAISSRVAQNFLEANGIEYTASPSNLQRSPADIAEHAKAFTVAVECQR